MEGLARSIGVAESSGACEQRLSTHFDKKVKKLAKEKTALRGGLSDIGARNGYENVVVHWK